MNEALKRIREPLERARARFLALQPRERWILSSGAVVVLLTVLYLAVWEPVVDAHRQKVEALESSRLLAIRLEQAAAQVQRAGGQRGSGANTGRSLSLMAAVDQASKQGSLGRSPTRIQPEGDREVRVWFEDVSFDAMVPWLADLQLRYGVGVQTLDIEPQATPGKVNVRLSLVRGT
ncbi:MAG: type II secretion system protein GspM [Panacagrimonas sp.]